MGEPNETKPKSYRAILMPLANIMLVSEQLVFPSPPREGLRFLYHHGVVYEVSTVDDEEGLVCLARLGDEEDLDEETLRGCLSEGEVYDLGHRENGVTEMLFTMSDAEREAFERLCRPGEDLEACLNRILKSMIREKSRGLVIGEA